MAPVRAGRKAALVDEDLDLRSQPYEAADQPEVPIRLLEDDRPRSELQEVLRLGHGPDPSERGDRDGHVRPFGPDRFDQGRQGDHEPVHSEVDQVTDLSQEATDVPRSVLLQPEVVAVERGEELTGMPVDHLEMGAEPFPVDRGEDLGRSAASGQLHREPTEERGDREIGGLLDQPVIEIGGQDDFHRPGHGERYVSRPPHQCGRRNMAHVGL